jgi:RNA ligase (TIGR02306 family)
MARKLVSIRQVSGTKPIIGCPHLELATVDGWTCAIRSGTFASGDLALFFEIDCFLPVQPLYLAPNNPIHLQRKTWRGHEGIHVNTQMVGKEISQGVLMRLENFPEIEDRLILLTREHGQEEGLRIAMQPCFAQQLGVMKWVLSPSETATKLGRFPAFIAKTDLTRLQDKSNMSLFEEAKCRDTVWQESVKMDGSSMTVYFVRADFRWMKSLPHLPEGSDKNRTAAKGRFGVCSREWDLVEDEKNRFWKAALENRLPEKLAKMNCNVAIQGELVGSTINGNRHGYQKGQHEFFVYTMWDIDRQERLSPSLTEERTKLLDLRHVPVLGYVRLPEIASSNEDLLERAKGRHADDRKREGLVFKAVNDGRSFKVIANDYLLEHEE